MSKIYTLSENELGAIVKTVVENTSVDTAAYYALLLADKVQGRNMSAEYISEVFESDEDAFPSTREGLATALINAGH